MTSRVIRSIYLVKGGTIFASGFSFPSGVATEDLDLDLLEENATGVAKDPASCPM